MKLKEMKRRGQAMVLWAVLAPLLILFVGVGMDLGWYYLTVSRLQNAADAAVLAGAIKLTEENERFKDYYVYSLTSKPSSDFKENYTIYYVNSETKEYANATINKNPGIYDAQIYANKNLSGTAVKGAVKDNWNTVEKNNGVTFKSNLYARKMDIDRKDNGIKYYQVTLTEKVSHLFLRGFKPMEAKVVAYALLKPHKVDLVTIINQLEKTRVIGNWMYQNKYKDSHKGNWNHYRQTMDGDKMIAYQAGDSFRTETVNVAIEMGSTSNNVNTSAGQTTSANGNNYYLEKQVDSLNIDFNQDVRFTNKFTTKDWDLRTTDLTDIPTIEYRGMRDWSETHGYDLRIQGLINFNSAWRNRHLIDDDATNDADIPDILWTRIEGDPIWSDDRSNNEKSLNSVHQMIINVHANNTETQIVRDEKGKDQLVYKYRPFFIFYMGPESNVKILEKTADQTFSEISADKRKSQPVILNLYEDWNAILYMPNSPVIINGNGHKLTGFVIAKEYLQLKDDSDYSDYGKATDDFDNNIYVKKSDTVTEDALNTLVADNEYIVHYNYEGYRDLYDKSLSDKIKSDTKYLIIDPRYVKGLAGSSDANYVKALKKFNNLTDDDIVKIKFPETDPRGSLNNTQSYYVAKKDLKNKSDLPSNEPDPDVQNSVNNKSSNYVPVIVESADETDGESTEEKKYILKTKLPFVRVYKWRDSKDYYSYVPVCDLKIVTSTTDNNYVNVTLADDENNAYASGALSKERYKVDDTMDTWKVPKSPLQEIYQKRDYESNVGTKVSYNGLPETRPQIERFIEDGCKYFIRRTLAIKNALTNLGRVDEYHRVIFKGNASDEVRWLSEDTKTYYVKIVPGGSSGKNANGADVENPIFIDNKGDLQVKPVPLGDISYKNNKYRDTYRSDTNGKNYEEPDDPSVYKTFNDIVTGELKDYRDLKYEVVYYKHETFNLKKLDENLPDKTKKKLEEKYTGKEWAEIMKMDSYYSYFLIPSLERTNYHYLNVNELKGTVNGKSATYNGRIPIIFADDMFFTTKRASWID